MSWDKFLMGASAIYAVYLISNVFLQKIYSQKYQSVVTGQYDQFQHPGFLVYVESLFCAGIGLIKGIILKQPKCKVPHIIQIQLGFNYSVHILAANVALLYIPYPSQVVGMNCRYIMVVIVGVYMSRVNNKSQKLKKKKILMAFLATIGAVSYNLFKAKSVQSESHLDPTKYWIGYMLVGFAVFSDAFFLDTQAYAKQKYHPTANQMLTSANFYTFVFCALVSILKGSFIDQFKFCIEHPTVNIYILVISVLQAMGQIVVYYVIINFRQHVFPLIAMTRKIMTILISIILFNHTINSIQIVSLMIVFSALSFEILEEFAFGHRIPLKIKYFQDKKQ